MIEIFFEVYKRHRSARTLAELGSWGVILLNTGSGSGPSSIRVVHPQEHTCEVAAWMDQCAGVIRIHIFRPKSVSVIICVAMRSKPNLIASSLIFFCGNHIVL